MQYLNIENASKSFGEKVILDGINLSISKGDKIGLVAKNGTGKSTLIKIIADQEDIEGEQAKIQIAKDLRISFLWQEPELNPDASIIEEIFSMDNPKIEAIKAYEMALHIGSDKEIESSSLAMESLKAWDMEARVKELLFRLKISNIHQKIHILSGGQKKRVAMAKILIEEPDFLILDEPTNHLDIEMIEWLEGFLQKSNLTLFMVTHDRYFLERICNEIVELDQGKIYSYKGNYSDFLEKRSARLLNEAAVLEKTKKLFKRELEWMRRQPKARGTKAKSRIDHFYGVKEKAHVKRDDGEVQLMIKSDRLGGKILECRDISMGYEDLVLIKNFSYKFKKGERVGIVGKNGSGKSTLLKLMTQELKSKTGKVIIGETVNFGHYRQDGLDLSNDKTIIDVVREIAEYIPLEKGKKMTAESLLERFLFPRSQQRVYVSKLSGGEKRRLHLLTILMQNPNFLILDEPTNDLDIMTLNILEDFLLQFTGCLIIVSHDRFFMDKLVDHLFILEGDGKVKDYNGNYNSYRLQKEQEKKVKIKTVSSKEKKEEAPTVRKLSYLEKKEIQDIEKRIDQLEKRKSEINKIFMDQKIEGSDIEKLSIELGEINNEIEKIEERWIELSEFL